MTSIIQRRRAALAASQSGNHSFPPEPRGGAVHRAPAIAVDAIDRSTDADPSDQTGSPPLPADLPPAAICQTCQCPVFWLDAYGGLHCFECSPPRTSKMVKRRLVAAIRFGETERRWIDFDREMPDGRRRLDNYLSTAGAAAGGRQPGQSTDAAADAARGPTAPRPKCMDLPPGEFTDLICRLMGRFPADSAGPSAPSTNPTGSASPAAPPIPPRGAEIFYLRKTGRIQSTAKGSKGKEFSDAVMFTWEGANQWYEVPQQSAVPAAGSKLKGPAASARSSAKSSVGASKAAGPARTFLPPEQAMLAEPETSEPMEVEPELIELETDEYDPLPDD